MDKDQITKLIEQIVNKKIDDLSDDLSSFKKWRSFDSVTDIYSPITGASPQIGFFGVPKVARPATGGSSATFVANAGTAVNDASTFDGYTLKQIVKALRNLGLLT